MSIWQTEAEAETNRQGVQQQFPIPNLDSAQMVDREVRASRFVSHLAGHTDSDKQPKPNRAQRLWRAVDQLRREQEGHQLVLPV